MTFKGWPTEALDFYEHLEDPEPFWIGPAEAMKSLEILKEAYRLSGVGPAA